MLATFKLWVLAAISSRFRSLRFSRLILRRFRLARITIWVVSNQVESFGISWKQPIPKI